MIKQVQDKYDAFYVVRIVAPIPSHMEKTNDKGGVYLTTKGRLGALSKAQRFETIDQAEARASRWSGNRRYTLQIEFCTRERSHEPTADPAQRAIVDELMQIPYPYRRTAYNWMRGVNVKELLLKDSQETYQRHRRFLLDYEIDITRAPQVRLLTPKRRKIELNNVPAATGNDPKHYFSPATDRPGASPSPKNNKKD